jgi:hypothetical protein
MGSRANIKIEYSDGNSIYFYSHWGGSEVPAIVREAIVRGESRWGDEAYLARIIFCEMIQKDVLGTSGFGISPWGAGDANWPLLTVNMKNETVSYDGVTLTFDELKNFSF